MSFDIQIYAYNNQVDLLKSGVNEPTCLKKESNRLTNSLECVYYRKDFGDIKAYSNKNIFNKASISTTDSFDINLIDDKKIKNAKIVSPFYKTITSTNSSADITFRIPIDFGLDSDKEYIVANKITNIKGEVNREGIRRMTPREWARLQGFPDSFKIVVADASAYKQFGNSVAIPAIQATAEKELQMLGII